MIRTIGIEALKHSSLSRQPSDGKNETKSSKPTLYFEAEKFTEREAKTRGHTHAEQRRTSGLPEELLRSKQEKPLASTQQTN